MYIPGAGLSCFMQLAASETATGAHIVSVPQSFINQQPDIGNTGLILSILNPPGSLIISQSSPMPH